MTKSTLRFINHACCLIESPDSLLLFDPWLEGTAFNESWGLLDSTTSNLTLLQNLPTSTKSLYVWVSHEHSDHLSISFIRELVSLGIQATYMYQRSSDRRVVDFLKLNLLKVIEIEEGQAIELDEDLCLWGWSFYSGDSYCLIKSGDVYVLNLNDCDAATEKYVAEILANISSVTNQISVLFTQFGYANWVGNEDQQHLRISEGEKIVRKLALQITCFEPTFVVPFASFAYFCHQENSYMNYEQITPEKLRSAAELEVFQDQIFFMKSGDTINLDLGICGGQLLSQTSEAEKTWASLSIAPKFLVTEHNYVDIGTLIDSATDFIKKCNKSFFYAPSILSFLRLIPCINLKIWDSGYVLRLSYHRKPISLPTKKWDIGLSSRTAEFLLRREYGVDTLSVSARFQVRQSDSFLKVQTFFALQYFLKESLNNRSILDQARAFTVFPARAFAHSKRRLLKFFKPEYSSGR